MHKMKFVFGHRLIHLIKFFFYARELISVDRDIAY